MSEVILEKKDLTQIPGNPAYDGFRRWDQIMAIEDPEELAETLRNLFTGKGAGKSARKQLENIKVAMGERKPHSGLEAHYSRLAEIEGTLSSLQNVFKDFIFGAMGLGGGAIRREDLDNTDFMMVDEDAEIEINGKKYLLEKGDKIAVQSGSVVKEETSRLFVVSGGDYGLFTQPVIICNDEDLDDAIEEMRMKVDSVTINPLGNPISTKSW